MNQIVSSSSAPQTLAALSSDTQTDFRQLRHQTKNALARILAQVGQHTGVGDPVRTIAADIERRILLTAEISDALFGLTMAPGDFLDRLHRLGTGLVGLLAEEEQDITVSVAVHGTVEPQLEDALLRVAHELVGNAVRHGMHMRLTGHIGIEVDASRWGVSMAVTDDGWGCGSGVRPGEGLKLAGLLVEPFGGTLAFASHAGTTLATVTLPCA